MSHFIYILIAFYFLQLVVDQCVFFYPAVKFSSGSLSYTSFNMQKRLSLLLRFVNVAITPYAAYLLERGHLDTYEVLVPFMLTVSSVLSILFIIIIFNFYLKIGFFIKMKHGQTVSLKIASLIYAFHYVGLPISLFFASENPDYRATIMQLVGLLNASSTFFQIWFVDRTINRTLDIGTPNDVNCLLMTVLRYRLFGKIALSLILIISFKLIR